MLLGQQEQRNYLVYAICNIYHILNIDFCTFVFIYQISKTIYKKWILGQKICTQIMAHTMAVRCILIASCWYYSCWQMSGFLFCILYIS